MCSDQALESKIVQAYVLLKLTRADSKGQQSVSVDYHGTYDVRLVEHPAQLNSPDIMFWVELFDHQTATSLDSYAVNQMDDAVAAARNFILRAEALHQSTLQAKH
jgi:hypothetical protein